MGRYVVKDTCHRLQEILHERSRRRVTLASDSCLKTRAYLSFKEIGQSPNGKTRIWGVYAEGDDQLGEIKWHAPWREYCYFQNSEIVMSTSCLTEVAVFLAKQKHWHKVSTEKPEAKP